MSLSGHVELTSLHQTRRFVLFLPLSTLGGAAVDNVPMSVSRMQSSIDQSSSSHPLCRLCTPLVVSVPTFLPRSISMGISNREELERGDHGASS